VVDVVDVDVDDDVVVVVALDESIIVVVGAGVDKVALSSTLLAASHAGL
jgi:hypothetical protein